MLGKNFAPTIEVPNVKKNKITEYTRSTFLKKEWSQESISSIVFFLNIHKDLQYRSKVWTHLFSFFKTAVEIGPLG